MGVFFTYISVASGFIIYAALLIPTGILALKMLPKRPPNKTQPEQVVESSSKVVALESEPEINSTFETVPLEDKSEPLDAEEEFKSVPAQVCYI
jgi:hypothetical protein